jgi:hypothetical protein
MNELDLQSMIIDAVIRQGHGHAHKMSHRFLIGIVDLAVKLPKWPTGFLEVKQRDRPTTDARFTCDVTHPQQTFLRNYDAVGTPCGIESFLQDGYGSGLKLWLNISTWETMSYGDNTIKPFTLTRSAYTFLGKHDERAGKILDLLHGWHINWKEQHA